MRGAATDLNGCITAMVTPFNKELEVDYEGLRQSVRFQASNSVSGIAPLGTTGESPTINDSERGRIISAVVEEAEGKLPVIVGTGTNSTEKTIRYSREAESLGADAVLVVTPYYNKPSQEGIYRHFKAVSESISIPLIVYNIHGRTGVNIETSTLLRMSSLENIKGVKEASGNILQMMEVIERLPEDFRVLSGDDNMTLPLMALGGAGVISVVSNLLPKRVSEMVRYALKGDFEAARRIHFELLPIFRGAFLETNPAPIKAAMFLSGMPSGNVRMPLCEISEANAKRLEEILQSYGELKSK